MISNPQESATNPVTGSFWQDAERHGCDMSLLEEALALSPAQRIRLHGLALERLEWLRSGRLGIPGESRPTP